MKISPEARETLAGIQEEANGDFMYIVENYANAGICLECGELRFGGVEPDATKYECFECGEHAVEGLENALVMI